MESLECQTSQHKESAANRLTREWCELHALAMVSYRNAATAATACWKSQAPMASLIHVASDRS